MRYRYRIPKPRTIIVKYAGKCACCGGDIKAGELADYYPARTIASRSIPGIAHIGGLDGNSSRCSAEIKQRAEYVRDPGEDAADGALPSRHTPIASRTQGATQ